MFNEKIVTVIGSVLVLCASAAPAEEYAPLEEIGVFGPYKRIHGFSCSENGTAYGFWGVKDKEFDLIINGRSETKEKRWPQGPFFTGNGATWLYFVEEKDGEFYVIVNGEKRGPYGGWPRVSCAPKGGGWAFTTQSEGRNYAVVNGLRYGPYETDVVYGGITGVTFSEDGTAWGFEASRGDHWAAVINGEEKLRYRYPAGRDYSFEFFPAPIAFSRDGSVWGHTGFNNGSSERRGFYAWINEKSYGPYKDISILNVSLDGRQWGVKVKRENGYHALVNGVEAGPFVDCGRVKVANGGSSWGVPIEKAGGWYMLINGVEVGPYSHVGSPLFSGNGESWAFAASKAETDTQPWFAVIDGEERGPFEKIRSLLPPQDGSSWAVYFARGGEEYLNINNTDYLLYPNDSLRRISSTENSEPWVCTTGYGPVVLYNGPELRPFAATAAFRRESEVGFYGLEELEGNYYRLIRYTAARRN
jgi:uncharacterized protein YbdZ (MbtH family)